MNSLLDLIIPFMMGFIMTLSGFMVALIGDWIKKILIIPIISMFLFDSLIIYMFYAIGITKIQIMMGIMMGTISKIIIFILYQKHLSNE
jgi:hypothetical protein